MAQGNARAGGSSGRVQQRGVTVVAFHSEDQLWCEAVINHVFTTSSVRGGEKYYEVTFSAHGTRATLPERSIRLPTRAQAHQPAIAGPATLSRARKMRQLPIKDQMGHLLYAFNKVVEDNRAHASMVVEAADEITMMELQEICRYFGLSVGRTEILEYARAGSFASPRMITRGAFAKLLEQHLTQVQTDPRGAELGSVAVVHAPAASSTSPTVISQQHSRTTLNAAAKPFEQEYTRPPPIVAHQKFSTSCEALRSSPADEPENPHRRTDERRWHPSSKAAGHSKMEPHNSTAEPIGCCVDV